MRVINFTTDADTIEDDDIGGGYRTDGIVKLEGREVFRVQDIGWMLSDHDRDAAVTRAFATKLKEVLA